jgi:hypothetical protein
VKEIAGNLSRKLYSSVLGFKFILPKEDPNMFVRNGLIAMAKTEVKKIQGVSTIWTLLNVYWPPSGFEAVCNKRPQRSTGLHGLRVVTTISCTTPTPNSCGKPSLKRDGIRKALIVRLKGKKNLSIFDGVSIDCWL